MQDDEETEQKHPIDMTSDELLDYAIAPEVAERLRSRIQEDCDPDDDD